MIFVLESISAGIDVANYVDFRLVVFLLCIGFLVKHFIIKFPNKLIPYLLIVISLAYMLITMDSVSTNSIMNAIIDAIISGAIAVGLHSSGKGIINIFKTDNNSESTADIDEYSEEEEEESVDEDSEVVDDINDLS